MDARILIVGGAGTGKTTFLNTLTHGASQRPDEKRKPPRHTFGCRTAVVLHDVGETSCALQLIEVGAGEGYARGVFFDTIDAIVVVSDSSLEDDPEEGEQILCEYAAHVRQRVKEWREQPMYKDILRQAEREASVAGQAATTTPAAVPGMRHRGNNDSERASVHQPKKVSVEQLTEPFHRTVERTMRNIPILVVANKADVAAPNLVTSMMSTAKKSLLGAILDAVYDRVAGLTGGTPGSHAVASTGARREPSTAFPRPPGSVSKTKVHVRIATDSESRTTWFGCLDCSRPKPFHLWLDAPLIWTNCKDPDAAFPRDAIDHFFDEVCFAKFNLQRRELPPPPDQHFDNNAGSSVIATGNDGDAVEQRPQHQQQYQYSSSAAVAHYSGVNDADNPQLQRRNSADGDAGGMRDAYGFGVQAQLQQYAPRADQRLDDDD